VDPFPRILRKLMNHKSSWAFNGPVDAEFWGVLDYYEIIKTPMDFGTIATHLDAGEYKSENSGHGPLRFVTDIRQVFHNAWTYNEPGHQVHDSAQELGRIFETELRKFVGDLDPWGLLAGTTIAQCKHGRLKPKSVVGDSHGGGEEQRQGARSLCSLYGQDADGGRAEDGDRAGGVDGGVGAERAHKDGDRVEVEDRDRGGGAGVGGGDAEVALVQVKAIDQLAIKAVAETRSALAITAANETRDDVDVGASRCLVQRNSIHPRLRV